MSSPSVEIGQGRENFAFLPDLPDPGEHLGEGAILLMIVSWRVAVRKAMGSNQGLEACLQKNTI